MSLENHRECIYDVSAYVGSTSSDNIFLYGQYLKENDQDGEIVGRIESLLLKLKELAEERNVIAALPKAKEKHLITMESFGICRCGGILTFETSG